MYLALLSRDEIHICNQAHLSIDYVQSILCNEKLLDTSN